LNLGAVLYVLGRLCMIMAVLLLVPLLFWFSDSGLPPDLFDSFVVSAAVSLGLGMLLTLSFEMEQDAFGVGEAFATVTASWVVFTLLGAMPFLISGYIASPLDASFEVLSGFTTTGASILPDPSVLPEPLLLWRAMTQWIGGMGIVALSVAVLPALGAGGNFLFQAEVPGPESEKLLPRISSTAKLLWVIYMLLTVCEFGALRLAGMNSLDAICHTFATVATGGFGTRADSLTSFSPAVQWIVLVFMFLAGANFVMLLHILRRRFARAARNVELRAYVAILVGATALCAASVYRDAGAPEGVEPLVRAAAFTTFSLLTGTGFVITDYQIWPDGLHALLLLLMVCGPCAGSTGGGAKVIRLIVTAKAGFREVRRLLRPRAIFVVKVGARPLSDQLVFKTAGFFVLYVLSTVVFTMVLLALGSNAPTSLSAVIACLSNIGPGLDAVGPTSNYAAFDPLSKLVLMFCMLLGRLEFYSVLVLLVPLAWRR